MSAPVYLAIDSGTSRMKAALMDGAGRMLGQIAADLPGLHPFDGASEADMNLTWETLCSLTRALAEQFASEWENLAGLAISAQGDGCWPVDAAGQPVRNALLWNDTRTRQTPLNNPQEVEAYCIAHSQTQLFPGAAPVQLVWMKQIEPQNYGRIRWVLHCKDWLNFCLTGVAATDPSDSSTSLLNVRTYEYETGLLDLLGIPESKDWFPPVYRSGQKVGEVTSAAAQQSGLPQGLPVVMGGIDVAVVAAGAGVVQPGDALTIIGTTLCNEVVLNEERYDPRETRGSTLRHVSPDSFLRVMATSSGTSSIDWARRTFAAGLSFAEIEQGISEIPAGCEGVMFQPYLYGERAPFRDAAATGGFYGLSARHTPMHLMRAVYEGLAMSLVDCYQVLPAVRHVILAGGGANSAALCQMMADGLGLPTGRLALPELGLQGAFLLLNGQMQAGEQADVRWFQPDTARHNFYQAQYKLFVELRNSLGNYWSSREALFRSRPI